MHLLHVNGTDFQNLFFNVSLNHKIKPLLYYSGGVTFIKKRTNTKTRIILTSNLHHGRKKVALNPERPEFSTRTGRVATAHISWSNLIKLLCNETQQPIQRYQQPSKYRTFWQNAPLVLRKIAIFRITFVKGLFILKLQVVCPERYCENSVGNNCLRIFQNFSEQLLFKTLGDCFRFHLKLLLCL